MDHKRAPGSQLGTTAPWFPHSDYSGQVCAHSLGQNYQAMAPFSDITAVLSWFKSSSPAFLSLLTQDIGSFFLLAVSDQSPGRMLKSKLTLHLEEQHVNMPTCRYRERLKGHAETECSSLGRGVQLVEEARGLVRCLGCLLYVYLHDFNVWWVEKNLIVWNDSCWSQKEYTDLNSLRWLNHFAKPAESGLFSLKIIYYLDV